MAWDATFTRLRQLVMKNTPTVATSVTEYIAGFPPPIQSILKRIREVVREAAPQAKEVISYRMPALRQHGVLVYYAAFKKHIGLYPPIAGDEHLEKAIARYAGEKGNLRFPFDQPIPYELIARIVKLRVQQDRVKADAKRRSAKS